MVSKGLFLKFWLWPFGACIKSTYVFNGFHNFQFNNKNNATYQQMLTEES